mmetsp:Transcript_3885/g.9143  ORF Transcript_3885/g.9143 Transcript_3885/m.9143 type:complete len:146 (+) Transcript_3885:2-439(+)
MKALGEAESPPIHFSFDGLIANTENSHRMLEWVLDRHGASVQQQVVEALSRRYFTEAQNLGDLTVLVDAAAECCDTGGLLEFLQDGLRCRNLAEVSMQLVEQNTVMGVPHFVIGGKYHVPGAQDFDVCVRLLLRAVEREQAQAKL